MALPAREAEGRGVRGQAKALDDDGGALAGHRHLDAVELEAKRHLVEDGGAAELAIGVLEEGRHVGGEGAHGRGARVESGDMHAALARLEQPVEELGERGLSGAVLPHERQDFPAFH